jgi:PAS domain S-box-containing protein
MEIEGFGKAVVSADTAVGPAGAETADRIIDAMPHFIMVLSAEGRALDANLATLAYTGLSLEEVQSDAWCTCIFHPVDVERLRDARQRALARGVPFENEERARRKDGQYRWFLIQYNPLLDDDGRVVRWYATGTDIEDRKYIEDRIRGENAALREEIDCSSMFEEIVGSSAPLRRVLAQIAKAAPTDSTVLVLGETGTGKELIAQAIHNLILGTHLLQKYGGLRKPPTISVGGLGPRQKRRATELLRENLAGRIRLSQVAQECGLSVSHFARSFKATFGVTTHRWLVQRRIERSQELLIHTLDSLADIAVLAGFADQAAFTRTFHQTVGTSPGRWRRDHQRR